MSTDAYRRWVAAGRPFTLATPIRELREWAEAEAVACLGTIGNEEHLQASRPQDHTPFSFTAWPETLPGYVVTAIDLANVGRGGATLGAVIEAQFRAGMLPWLKYMNHAGRHIDARDLDGDGTRYEVQPSSDNHVHLSIRTDWLTRSIGTFRPWAVVPAPVSYPRLMVDGQLGPATIRRWQTVMRTPVDGVISRPSLLVAAVQRHLNVKVAAGLLVDGIGIRQDGTYYRTTAALQRYIGTTVDGRLSVGDSQCVRAVQARLNNNWF